LNRLKGDPKYQSLVHPTSGGVTNLEMDGLIQANNAELIAFSQVYQSDLAKVGVVVPGPPAGPLVSQEHPDQRARRLHVHPCLAGVGARTTETGWKG
jgi:hypothetical protein